VAHGWRVIIENGESALAGIDGLREDVLVCHDASKLKIADGEITTWVAVRNESILDVVWKRGTPE
jgi:hypothetical protein